MLLIVFILLLIVFIQNTLFYTLSLLAFTSVAVFLAVFSCVVQPLTGVILLLVYLGAVMILIGYICAVSPNLIIKYPSPAYFLIFFVLLFTFPLLPPHFPSFTTPLSLFYHPTCVSVFILIVFMLFVTLLIVTSNYYSPNGPFRSV